MSSMPILTELISSDFMKCPMCRKTFVDPIILPCLHSSCLDCIRKVATGVKVNKTDGSRLHCPMCKTSEYEWNGQDLIGWAPNYFLRGLQTLHKCRSEVHKTCDYCRYDNKSERAVSRCVECQDDMCRTCEEAHRRTKLTRHHQVAPFTKVRQGKYDQEIRDFHKVPCEVHPDQGIQYYCSRCEKVSCRDCKMSEHENHPCSDIANLSDIYKDKAKALIGSIRKRLPGLAHYIASLNEYSQHLTNRKDMIVEGIQKQAAELHKAIDDCRDSQIKDIIGDCATEQKLAHSKHVQFESLLTTLKSACDYLDIMFEHGRPEENMPIRDLVLNRLTNLVQQHVDPMATKLNMTFTSGECSVQALEAIFGKVRVTSVALNDHNVKAIAKPAVPEEIPLAASPLPCLPPPKISDDVELILTFESKGVSDAKDIWPTGIAVTDDGNIIVMDRENKSVKFFDENGSLIREFGKNSLSCPYDVTILRNGNLAITDYDDEDVKIFTPEGNLLAKLKGPMKYPRGITVDPSGNIVIVDAHGHRLVIHEPKNGKVIQQIDAKDENKTELLTDPYYVATNSAGHILVTDWVAPNVKIFSSDGVCLTKYGTYGVQNDQCLQPYGICVDHHGYIFVADNQNHRIHLLTPDAKFLCFVVNRKHGLWHPMALAITPDGHLAVTEALGKVKVFRYM